MNLNRKVISCYSYFVLNRFYFMPDVSFIRLGVNNITVIEIGTYKRYIIVKNPFFFLEIIFCSLLKATVTLQAFVIFSLKCSLKCSFFKCSVKFRISFKINPRCFWSEVLIKGLFQKVKTASDSIVVFLENMTS